jgi:hypothetical protein
VRRTVRNWRAGSAGSRALRWAALGVGLRWAALGAAGIVAVAGCGQNAPSWWRPGAAVLYGNTRITTVQLASEAANLSAAYQTYKGKLGSQLPYRQADIPRQALSWILRFAAFEQLRSREGIRVTATQEQQAYDSYVKLLKQQGATLAEFAVSIGMPPDMLAEYFRLVRIQTKLEQRLNHGTVPAQGTAAAQEVGLQIARMVCLAAKSLNVKVNPQYGVFDYNRFLVVPLPGELASGLSAAQAARLAPHC